MSRIAEVFQRLRAAERKALVTYITAGDPQPGATLGYMQALVDAGADIIELGVPFSDPMADGPVIQAACERALVHRTSLVDVIGMVREFRRGNDATPVVLMGYLNPIEAMGAARFAELAAEAGVDGALTVDLPPEESAPLLQALRKVEIDPIFLLAPTTPMSRVKSICAAASGFVYYVSLKGTTGSGALDTEAVGARLGELRKVTDLPIGVGFGVGDADSARRVAAVADAVVVGSAIVQKIAAKGADTAAAEAAVKALVAELREGVDAH